MWLLQRKPYARDAFSNGECRFGIFAEIIESFSEHSNSECRQKNRVIPRDIPIWNGLLQNWSERLPRVFASKVVLLLDQNRAHQPHAEQQRTLSARS
jgi:hypothetical protein